MVQFESFELTPTEDQLEAINQACRSMSQIVNSSINTQMHNFVSTLDHLPCDIVRSIWLIQNMELKIMRAKQKLYQIYSSNESTCEQIEGLCDQIERFINEIKSELVYLKSLINTHLYLVNDEMKLSKLVQLLVKDWSMDRVEEQWKQWTAFKRQVLIENNDTVPPSTITIAGGGSGGSGGGVKLRLKLKGSTGSNVSPSASPQEDTRADSNNGHTNGVQIKKLDQNGSDNLLLDMPKYKKRSYDKMSEQRPKEPAEPKLSKEVLKLQTKAVKPKDDTYCTCNGPAFGKMIGCENKTCEKEWFHFKCVGITKVPDDKWYCSENCRLNAEISKSQKKKKAKRRGW